jgi:hypothetical protein
MRASSGVKQNDIFYYQKEMEMLGNSKENKLRICIRQKESVYYTVHRYSGLTIGETHNNNKFNKIEL